MRDLSQRGFTFVELVISLIVIGIGITGVLLIYTETVARSADPLIRQQALAIAEAYLEEVVSRHHSDPDGMDGEGTRDLYDDVDDYDGLSDSPPTRSDGSALGAALDDFTVTVSVTDGTAALGVTAWRVDVSVTHTSGNSMALWSYRASY